MSENSQDLLRDTVFRLISHNQRIDTILDEVTTLKNSNGEECFIKNLTELTCIPLLNSGAHVLRSPVGQHGADQCSSKLISVMKSSKGQLLQQTQKDEVQATIHMLKHLMLKGSVDQSQLCHLLCKQTSLPVELLLTLHKEGVLSLEKFIQSKQEHNEFAASFTDQISQLSTDPAGTDCFSGMLAELMILGFSETKARDVTGVRKTASVLVDKVMLEVINTILLKSDDNETMVTLSTMFSSLSVDLDVLKRAFTHLLSLILSHKPVLKVSQAIRQQSGWAYGKIPSALSELYKQMLLPFDVMEILEILHRILEQQEVNWQLLLSFVSVTTVCFPESSKPFLDFTDSLLREGLESCDIETTIMGMLLARQACFQGPHVFLSYADWFQRTFSDSSRSMTDTRKSFTFFMKFLTDLTPYESAEHIKVHILRPPFVPAKCRQLLLEYIALAKTRLEDLKECLDMPGQESHSSSSDLVKAKDQTECEVNNAVTLFEATGKVATFVMEASIFRKPYYIGHFLPSLLQPRPLPDKPDTKMKLITALKKADKIPQSMYTNYETACKQEAVQLMQGVFLDVDSDEDLELSPLDQLENYLCQLTATVRLLCGNGENKPKHTIAETISQICGKIEDVLSVCRTGHLECPPIVQIDIDHQNIRAQHLQVVDALLNMISEALQASYTSGNPRFTWLQLLLQAVTQYSTLIQAVLKRIWMLIMNQGFSLENHHIDSLAAVLVELQLLGDRIPRIQLLGTCKQCSSPSNTLTELVMERVPLNSREWMSFTLRITCAYMKYVYSAHTDVEISNIVPSVVKKFAFLAPRLLPELRLQTDPGMTLTNDVDVVSVMYRSDIFQNLQKQIKLTLSDWVEYEMTIHPECDAITDFQRQQYYSWIVYNHFIHKSRQDGGCGGDYQGAAALIMKGVLTIGSSIPDVQPRCPVCVSQGRQSLYNSRCHMVNLLQELTRLFEIPNNHHAIEELPWLPQQLVDMLSCLEGNIARQTLVQQYFRLCLCLPSYLMFSDTPHTLKSCDRHLDSVVNFINAIIVDNLCEGMCLPSSITVYFTQGLVLCAQTNSYIDIVDSICQRCPSLLVSILVNVEAANPFIQLIRNDQSSVLGSLLQLLSKNTFSPIQDPWLCACVIFSQMLSGTYRNMVPAVHDFYRNFDKTLTEQICTKYAEILLLHLTQAEHFAEPQTASLVYRLQLALHGLLSGEHAAAIVNHLLSDTLDERTRNCVNKPVLELRTLTLLRYLRDHKEKPFIAKKMDLYCLTGLLRGIIAIGKLFDNGDIDSHTVQALPLAEITSITGYVTEVLNATPKSVLRQLDQEMVMECGPGVADAVVQAIMSHE